MRRSAPQRPAVDEEALLVARVARGDREALAALYDRHAPMLTSLARKIMGSNAEVSDLLHDVFLEAWERASSYDPERGAVRSWLALRMRSRALDRLASARVRLTVPLADPDASPLGTYVEITEPMAIRGALDRLTLDAREVLELTYFIGLTAKEIAARLDIPVGTVKSRLARALSLLEQTLDESRNHEL